MLEVSPQTFRPAHNLCTDVECEQTCRFSVRLQLARQVVNPITRAIELCAGSAYIACPDREVVIEEILSKGDLAHQSLLKGLKFSTSGILEPLLS